jgi:ribosomal protein L35AE/L33A
LSLGRRLRAGVCVAAVALAATAAAASPSAGEQRRAHFADPPSISIDDVTVTEGDSGTVNAIFTVTLSQSTGQTVTVDYATADNTAHAPDDYVAIPTTTLTFAPHETVRQVTVLVRGDTFDEAEETFFVNLSNPVNATIDDGQGFGTIIDDDPVPSLSIGDATVTEGNSGTLNATFTVSLNTASGRTVIVDYDTADGSAIGGSDYEPSSGTLTFPAGQTTRQVIVPVIGDTLDEPNEDFTVQLSNALNATIDDGVGLGTIVDDDPQPSLSINDVAVTEGDSGTVNATFTVSLSTASGRAVAVEYATADGSAHEPDDYQSRSGTLNFPAGQTARQVTVLVNGDTLDETEETFSVNLSNPVNATIADGQGIGTITDDDPEPSLRVNDVTVTEGDGGAVDASFTVVLLPASGRIVSVGYSTTDRTATAPADYVAAGGNLVFSPGQTAKTITVQVNGDTLDEIDETFTVDLSDPVHATLADPEGVGTIIDDDPLPSLTIGDATVAEGATGTVNANFTVSLNVPSGRAVSVGYASADGTATAGSDYQATSGTLLFAAGQISRQVTVPVSGDTLIEPDETFVVNLSAPGNATIGDGQGLGTIANDDAVRPPPPAPPKKPKRAALFAPPHGAVMRRPPLLAWRAVRNADFYNVQLYRRGHKILSLWPSRPRLKLHWRWTYRGRAYRLRPAAYTWVVWPGFGSPTQGRFGRMLGTSTFRMVGKARGR